LHGALNDGTTGKLCLQTDHSPGPVLRTGLVGRVTVGAQMWPNQANGTPWQRKALGHIIVLPLTTPCTIHMARGLVQVTTSH
jgi:hypothetical protein